MMVSIWFLLILLLLEQCVNIADDDYRENIFFEIAPDLKEFCYDDEEL
ncbi:hypothetical protein [Zunongwangia profunda]|nr:hypothetical protein [Zunongwangia profunda]MCC4229587.1 hypothetical protein [Zunongwangia profunda]